jgi:class 3 adenylate cyclase
MFFFGGRYEDGTDPARRALNAAADTMKLLEEEVIPEYNSNSRYPNIYPKIGVDYGNSLWGAYGAAPLYEVKATAFNVDVAAKMMAQCSAKEVAIGDSLREFIELDREKYLESGWVYASQLTVEGEEKKFSYQTWLFNWSKYLADQKEENYDLAKAVKGLGLSAPAIVGSRTTLGDAPLA